MAIQNPVTISTVDSNGDSVPVESVGVGVPVTIVEQASVDSNRFEDTIGYASGLAGEVTFAASENVRNYRIYPSALMRYTEDPINALQAEQLLETGSAQAVATSTKVDYKLALADVWSDWVALDTNPDIDGLRSLWFSLNAAGTGETVLVETR